MRTTPYDFNNYLPVFQDMLTSFKAPVTSVNTTTTLATKITTVNQTTIQKIRKNSSNRREVRQREMKGRNQTSLIVGNLIGYSVF
jgi:hypothetical protein